jgi:glutathione peroxidase
MFPSVALIAAVLGSACTEKTPPQRSESVSAPSATSIASGAATSPAPTGLYQLTANTLEGAPQPLAVYAGKVALVVNVASECGYTPQYQGLETLYETYAKRGFVILGFPSNDFGEQEPGGPKEIRELCSTKFHVTFPMFEKVQTSGPQQSPIYAFLGATHGLPQWNFHKYLVGKDGKVIAAFPSAVTPETASLVKAIEAALRS